MNNFPHWLHNRNPELLLSIAKIVAEQYGGAGARMAPPSGTPRFKVPTPAEPVLPKFAVPKTPKEDEESKMPSSPDVASTLKPSFPYSLFYSDPSKLLEQEKRIFYYYKPIDSEYIGSFSDMGSEMASKALAAFGYMTRTQGQFWYGWIPYFGSDQADINAKQDMAFAELSKKYNWEYYDGKWYRPKTKEEIQQLLNALRERITSLENEISKGKKEAKKALTDNEKMKQAFDDLAKSAGEDWIRSLQSGSFNLNNMKTLANHFLEGRDRAVRANDKLGFEQMNKNLSLVYNGMKEKYPQAYADLMFLRREMSYSWETMRAKFPEDNK